MFNSKNRIFVSDEISESELHSDLTYYLHLKIVCETFEELNESVGELYDLNATISSIKETRVVGFLQSKASCGLWAKVNELKLKGWLWKLHSKDFIVQPQLSQYS